MFYNIKQKLLCDYEDMQCSVSFSLASFLREFFESGRLFVGCVVFSVFGSCLAPAPGRGVRLDMYTPVGTLSTRNPGSAHFVSSRIIRIIFLPAILDPRINTPLCSSSNKQLRTLRCTDQRFLLATAGNVVVFFRKGKNRIFVSTTKMPHSLAIQLGKHLIASNSHHRHLLSSRASRRHRSLEILLQEDDSLVVIIWMNNIPHWLRWMTFTPSILIPLWETHL